MAHETSIEESNSRHGNSSDSSLRRSCQIFFRTFFRTTSGPVQILFICTCASFCLGSTIGIVPDVVGDRYARIRYGYTGRDCTTFERLEKPDACQSGADDAQAAAAASVLVQSLLTLVFNPVVGSLSDVRGRRGVILISLVLMSLGPLMFVVLQMAPSLNPLFYYAALSLSGVVDLLSMTFAALSDTLPEDVRAAGYGVLLAGFYGGFCLAPSLPLFMDHFQVSVFSVAMALVAFVVALFALPETLPIDVSDYNLSMQQQQQHGSSSMMREETTISGSSQAVFTAEHSIHKHWLWLARTATRPLQDISILYRDRSFRLLAAGSFFSAMVYSSDKTFVIYYIEDQLNVRDDDLAHMFLIFGSLGIVVQAFLLQPMLRIIGEKPLLITAFISGTIHNALYGLARTKSAILMALCLSQLTKVNFPLLSSFASRRVSANEQGRVQGALFALNALANAAGPMLLEVVYNHTKDDNQSLLGPGTMFLCASCLYAIGTVLVSFLPRVQTVIIGESESFSSMEGDDEECHRQESGAARSSLGEPLIGEVP